MKYKMSTKKKNGHHQIANGLPWLLGQLYTKRMKQDGHEKRTVYEQ